MFKDNTIRKRVLAVVNGLVEQAQTDFENGTRELEEKHEEAISALEVKLKTDKGALADKLVDGIVARFR